MRILLTSLALCLTCTAGAQDRGDRAARDEAALAAELVGFTPERTTSCVRQQDLRGGLKAYGDVLVYRGTASERFVTRTSGGCGRVGDDSYLVTRTPSTQLCRGDIAQAVDRTSQFVVGGCSFGDFTRYRRQK